MNPKQTAPLLLTLPALAAAAPTIIIGGAIGLAIALVLKALLSDDKQKQPETASVQANPEARKPAETTVFRQISAEIPAKPAPVQLASVPRAVAPLRAVQLVPRASVPAPATAIVPVIKTTVQAPLPPVKKKFVTREDLATVFQHGARSLTRTAAVAALKRLGFGKTAAYAALMPDGRFAAWLQFAPDGIVTWTDGHGA
jgi:hypothetical protein